MKKILLLLTAVIILVCLNWFSDVSAQDLSQLTPEQRAEIQKRLASREKRKTPGVSSETVYKTQELYDTTITARRPALEDERKKDTAYNTEDITPLLYSDDSSKLELTPFEDLKPFGTKLFEGPTEQSPPDDIATDNDYILGPGDNIIVYLWGRVEKEYNLTLDRRGIVFIPKVGEIPAWGLRITDFREVLAKKFSSVYTGFDLTVSLGKIRSIRIYLTGEIKRPGAYSVSSLTSLYNALYLAGGPNERGSMRDIRLMRSGKQIAAVDLYKFLLSGDNSSDLRLQTGDAIFVPVAATRVAIRGEIVRPSVYELNGEETVSDLLALAGGPRPQAYLKRVMLETISENREWEVIDLDLEGDTAAGDSGRFLKDGDRVTVYSIIDFRKNMVSIYGKVKHPGYYERSDTTRLSHLLNRAQLQEYDVYLQRANLFRRHSDWRREVIPFDVVSLLNGDTTSDIFLQDRDSIHIYSIEDISYPRFVYIEGEVQSPGKYPIYDRITLGDLIFLAGSFTRGASRLRAEIARTDSLGEISILYANLSDSNGLATELQEEDRVYIRPIPQWQRHRAVTLTGNVQYPGEYIMRSRSETLYQLLQRAGGFTYNAFPKGTIFERRSIGETLERLQVPTLLKNSSSMSRDSLGNVRRDVLFEYEEGSVNRLIIDLDKIVNSEGRKGDIVLAPGDRIHVPSRPSGISVLGAVGSQGTLSFMEHKKVRDYIKLAGNFSPQADKKNTRLIRADGTVFAGNGTLGHKIEVGDVIVVPSKIKEKKDLSRSLATILSTTTGILTTVLLIDRL